MNMVPSHWECRVSAPGPPRKSPFLIISCVLVCSYSLHLFPLSVFICRGCCNRYHRGQGGSLNNRKLLSQLWRPEVQGQGVSGAGSFWKLCALPAPWAPAPWRPSVPGLTWPSLTSSLHLLSCPGGLPSVTGTPWLLLSPISAFILT